MAEASYNEVRPVKKKIPVTNMTLFIKLDEIFQTIPSGNIIYPDILIDIQKANRLLETLISDIKKRKCLLMNKKTNTDTKLQEFALHCQYFQETNQNKHYVGYCTLKKAMVATYCCEHHDQYPKYCPLDDMTVSKPSKSLLDFFSSKTFYSEKNSK